MKKLSEIDFTNKQLLDFARVHTFDGEVNNPFSIFDRANAAFDSTVGFAATLYFSGGAFKYSVKRTAIKVDCDLSPDSTVILQAFLYLANWPEAQKMLWHYLNGKGEDVLVDTDVVFESDPNLKSYALRNIFEAVNGNRYGKKKTAGNVRGGAVHGLNFKQSQYSTDRWRMAFGAINIRWEMVGELVYVWFDDTYAWHPEEPRTDQCVHQAMTRAQRYGAKNFYYFGTKLRFNRQQLERAAR